MASRKRLRNDWLVPGRAQVIAEAITEPEPRVPGRKDRRTVCKAAPGRQHEPRVIYAAPRFRPGDSCRWHPSWNWKAGRYETGWLCFHAEHCTHCGKVFRTSVTCTECPAYPGSAEQRAGADATGAEQTRETAARRSRRPVISGPQRYRRGRDATTG